MHFVCPWEAGWVDWLIHEGTGDELILGARTVGWRCEKTNVDVGWEVRLLGCLMKT